ncbi:MAG: hypothetical protein AAF488_16285 [Planctomycetota bacterium]
MSLVALLFTSALLCSADAPAPPEEAQWFRGNLHTHSLWSDGDNFPEMIVDEYVSRGYHFLALSDHNILSRGPRWMYTHTVQSRAKADALGKYRARFGDEWVELRGEGDRQEVRLKPLDEFRPLFEKPGRFLLLEAQEVTASFKRLPVHINATNLVKRIAPQRGASVRQVIRNTLKEVIAQAEREKRPILAHLNHPNFGYAVTAEDLAHVVEERFFEVYNGHPAVNHRGDELHVNVERMWDIANAIRIGTLGAPLLYGLATDDSHHYHAREGSLTGRGWIMVRSTALTPAALIGAMERGDFYASSGVTLSEVRFDAEAGTLEVEVEAQEGATYRIDFVGTRKGVEPVGEPRRGKDGEPLEQVTAKYPNSIGETFRSVEGARAIYRCEGNEMYVRAVITSSLPVDRPVWEGQRRKAWTQPVQPALR